MNPRGFMLLALPLVAMMISACSEDDNSTVGDSSADGAADSGPMLDTEPPGPDGGVPDTGADSQLPVDAGPPDGFVMPDITVPDAAVACNTTGTPAAGTAGPTGKADILFVIDNSTTMETEHAALYVAATKLEAALGSTNYHIGVLNTDIGAGPYLLPSCEDCGGNGRLQAGGACTNLGTPYLTGDGQGNNNFNGTLAEAFRCLGSGIGTNGCGFEQPLQSAAIALTNPTLNAGFLRSDASLVLVIYTDEDDCSTKNPILFDPTHSALTDPLGPLTSFRCFEFGVTCDINDRTNIGPRANCTPRVNGPFLYDVSSHVALIQGLRPPGRVAVVVIAGPPAPVAVGMDGQNPVVQESCITSSRKAKPAIRLDTFSSAFGVYGAFHSICSPLDAAITSIATFAKTM